MSFNQVKKKHYSTTDTIIVPHVLQILSQVQQAGIESGGALVNHF